MKATAAVPEAAIVPDGAVVPDAAITPDEEPDPALAIVPEGAIVPEAAIVPDGAIVPEAAIVPVVAVVPDDEPEAEPEVIEWVICALLVELLEQAPPRLAAATATMPESGPTTRVAFEKSKLVAMASLQVA